MKAIVEGWLGGQAGGGAIADVITGRINPSGKLSETFPKKLQDTPTFPDFPALNRRASYGEGVFIGYRYYDKKDVEPLFPFGFGLSYTTFEYTGIKAGSRSIRDTDGVTIEVVVKNTAISGQGDHSIVSSRAGSRGQASGKRIEGLQQDCARPWRRKNCARASCGSLTIGAATFCRMMRE